MIYPARNVFTVPPGVPFLAALARAILGGGFPACDTAPPGALELARWTILLPTRRAARSLIAAFLDAGAARPVCCRASARSAMWTRRKYC